MSDERYDEIHQDILDGPNGQLQEWIDSGTAWLLEGHVGRTAMDALNDGACILGPEVRKGYWGNTIPAYFMVEEDTPGSLGKAARFLADIN